MTYFEYSNNILYLVGDLYVETLLNSRWVDFAGKTHIFEGELVTYDADRQRRLLVSEQAWLWGDLNDAMHHQVLNGYWSIRTEGLVQRILRNAAEVGITPWGEIPPYLLASGIYRAVAERGGYKIEDFESDKWLMDREVPYPPVWRKAIPYIENLVLENWEEDLDDGDAVPPPAEGGG